MKTQLENGMETEVGKGPGQSLELACVGGLGRRFRVLRVWGLG